jgi:xanthine/uracil permease
MNCSNNHVNFGIRISVSLKDIAYTDRPCQWLCCEIDQNDKARVFQTLLFTAGINTLLQTVVGTCLPCVVGGSYAYLVPTLSIIYSDRLQTIQDDRVVSLFFNSNASLIQTNVPVYSFIYDFQSSLLILYMVPWFYSGFCIP